VESELAQFDELFDKGWALDFLQDQQTRPMAEALTDWMLASGFSHAVVRQFEDPALWEIDLRHPNRIDLRYAREAAALVRAFLHTRGFEMAEADFFALRRVDGSYRIWFQLMTGDVPPDVGGDVVR
jgi:hypothetical protein